MPPRPKGREGAPLISVGSSHTSGAISPIHSPTLPSSPFQVAAAAAGLDDHEPSPLSFFGHTTRAQAAFITLTLGLMFVMLLLYRPGQQEGLLCGSNQAHRQRMSYEIEARSMADIKSIQRKRIQAVTAIDSDTRKNLIQSTGGGSEEDDIVVSPTIGVSTDASGSSAANSGAATGTTTTQIKYVTVTSPRTKLWERKHFTAPPPKEPLKLPNGEPRPPVKTQQELEPDFRRWENDFQNLLNQRGGDIMKAWHDWIAPAVDPLEVRPEPLHTVDQSVVMLDGRQDPMVIFILKHTFHLLGPGWGLVIFHTQDNEAWFVDQLHIRPGEAGEHIQLQRVQPIRKEQANSLAMSTVFYERIGVETVLLIQPDAFMLRSPWLGTAEDRAAWDTLLANYGYIGAPWGWCREDWCRYGGNGGASLRKRSVMRDVISELRCGDWECHRHDLFRDQEHNPDAWWRTEDTYVAKVLHQHRKRWEGRLPNQEQSAEFSMEHMEAPNAVPFFVHKIWLYQPQPRWLPLLAHVRQYYPELN